MNNESRRNFVFNPHTMDALDDMWVYPTNFEHHRLLPHMDKAYNASTKANNQAIADGGRNYKQTVFSITGHYKEEPNPIKPSFIKRICTYLKSKLTRK